jgi:vitamin B12 transporter
MKLFKSILTAAGLMLALATFAQTDSNQPVVIHGKVYEAKGDPAISVSLQIENTYEGTYTDVDGSFIFHSFQRDSQKLVVYSLEYEKREIPIFINGQDSLYFDIEVSKGAISIDDVMVLGIKEFKTSDKQKTNVLNQLEILTITTDANVMNAFRVLPGVQPVGESSGLFIRGGTNNETQTFIDGLRVDKFSNSSPKNMAASSRFSPNMFQGSFFSSGGYSAQYGQGTSGALILETTDMPMRSSAELGGSPLFLQGGAQMLTKDEKNTFGATFNYLNLGLVFDVIPVNMDFLKEPEMLDVTFNYKRKTGPAGMIKYYGSVGANRMGIQNDDLDNMGLMNQTRLKNKYFFSQATYTNVFPSDWKIYLGAGFSANYDDFRFSSVLKENGNDTVSDIVIDQDATLFQLRSVLSRNFKKSKLDLGGEYQHSINLDEQEGNQRSLQDHYTAFFTEYEQLVGARWSFRMGLRAEHYSLNDKVVVAPRFTTTYMIKKNEQVYGSFGVFYQKPEYQYLYQDRELDLYKSNHYIAGYKKGNNYRYFRVEAFRKDYQNLVRYSPEINSTGDGYAQGLELYWKDKKTLKVIEYWLSYSYLDTKRDYLRYPIAAQPTFASDHVVSLTLKKYFPKRSLNFGMSYAYANGRPYYNPNRPDELYLSDRTKDYHNVNLNIAYLPKIGDSFSVVVLTVSNLLGTDQVFGYEYSSTDFSRRRAIVPTNDTFVFLGFFMNFGIDRTQDIIDRELN